MPFAPLAAMRSVCWMAAVQHGWLSLLLPSCCSWQSSPSRALWSLSFPVPSYKRVALLLPELQRPLTAAAYALPDKPFAALLQVRGLLGARLCCLMGRVG